MNWGRHILRALFNLLSHAKDVLGDDESYYNAPVDESVPGLSIVKDNQNHFCRKCGDKLLENSKFCRKCGTKVQEDEAKQMKVRYIGQNIGVDGLVNNGVYEVVYVDEMTGYLSIIDESGEDYLYHSKNPRPFASPNHPGGRFEIVEDDNEKTLERVIGN